MYIGNNLQVAYPTYKNIDDISGSFNGVTTSFALTVGGVAPTPLPKSSNQCLISVNGVVLRPDDSGTEGFRLSGGNIVFSVAPSSGVDFFGVILAGADYVNVGVNYPSGTAAAPSITFDNDLDTGIYSPGANQVGVSTGGTSRLVVDSSGNVTTGGLSLNGSAPANSVNLDSSGRLLVGASTSLGKFFNNTSSIDHRIQSESSTPWSQSWVTHGGTNAASGSYLTVGRSRGTTAGSNTVVASGDLIGSLNFQGADGSEFVEAANIKAEVDGTPGANDMPGRLVFSVTADGASSPTPRMAIYNNGVSGVFVTSADNFFLDNSAAAGTTYAFLLGRYGATGLGSGTVSFRVWNNGDVVNTNNSYGAISDIKLKENIVDAGSQWDDLKALQVRKYNFKEGQTHTQIGLIAQEVEQVSPGLVNESPDRDADGNDLGTITKSVNYSVLYMKAVKALQEAMERIETLEAKVAALEAP